MNLYSSFVFLHVITAIFGLGPLAFLAAASSRTGANWVPPDRFGRILNGVGVSLAAMFVTGAILIAFTHGALGETGWMRVSFGLFLFLAFLHGMARRQVRKMTGTAAQPSATLRALLWAMCAVTAAITYLMEAKPW
jgi:uncharacterized membrane protein